MIDCQVSRIVTLSTRFAYSDECYKDLSSVCQELPRKKVSSALVYLTSATLYYTLLETQNYSGSLALLRRLFYGEV